MWLLIYKTGELAGRVAGTNYAEPPEGSYDPERYEVKEWDGPEPYLGDPDAGILPDPDPTLADPDYADKVQQRVDFEALADKAAAEVAWLEETIPAIETMTTEEMRATLKRLARENMETLKAWRYVIRRLS